MKKLLCTAVLLAATLITALSSASCGRNAAADVTTAPDIPVYIETTAAQTDAPRVISVESASSRSGNVILVNKTHEYIFPDNAELTNLFLTKNDSYKVGNSSITLSPVAAEALGRMLDDFVAFSGKKDVIILSGYRDRQTQVEVYDERVELYGEEYAQQYVAAPGQSEHHTGLAADISVYTDEGASLLFSADPNYSWIDEHCADYGFILRYDPDKYDLTGVAGEEWHYRYVGIAHASYMYRNSLCLEEYISLLNGYTDPSAPLTFTAGDADYAVYTVPASAGVYTDIPVPYDADCEAEVSGNNDGGFIVTVKLS